MNDLLNEQNLLRVKTLRNRFLRESEANPHLYHRVDIKRVETEDWQLERFLSPIDTTDNTDADDDEAYNRLVRAMQWKHGFGLHDRQDGHYPRELFEIFGSEQYSTDTEGRLVLWVVHRNYLKIGELSLLFHQFLGHQIEKLDRRAGNRGWITANDCSGTGMANVDMSLAKFRVELLNYYPQGMRLGLNIDLPWLLAPVFRLIKTFMSKHIKDQILLIKRHELVDWIPVEDIPEGFGDKICVHYIN
ncbi:motile sperm domain-containing protein 2-like [Oppia nitens]|uniref:motile sperm domain-containing protein 2-like n=1 Tax=Oppia nitens TaxID=1686743 RepID=UPI0023DB1509|nr:motile sperm domain-containing protein 2-like [Oppia nitens]